jgi:phage baseplate assembly protein W
MSRRDFAFPFRIDPVSRQAAQSNYAAHVDQMIRQVLLTSPGERADLPEFGCGLRRLVFEPHSNALDATTNIIVTQALNKWLAGQIQVQKITVNGASGDPAQLNVQIDYILIETREKNSTSVAVL